MIIALDYDDTYTRDVVLWSRFIDTAVTLGHSVTFVTSRDDKWDNEDIEDDAKILGIGIVYCNGMQKAACFKAHVWIDDTPAAIPVYHGDLIVVEHREKTE